MKISHFSFHKKQHKNKQTIRSELNIIEYNNARNSARCVRYEDISRDAH